MDEETREAADLLARLYRSLVGRGAARERALRFTLRCAAGLFAGESPAGADELDGAGRELLTRAAALAWSKVQPAIFGTIFERSMDAAERHASGAHYTGEAEILEVVEPTIVRPLRERLEAATTAEELRAFREFLGEFRVLDPACGSGNFLVVAFRELRRLEAIARDRLHAAGGSRVGRGQLFGIDINPVAVELAKMTMRVAERRMDGPSQVLTDEVCETIRVGDALFEPWPAVHAIVGNPPFGAKNKLSVELGRDYVDRLRRAYPRVSGRADYCVYFFRKAHDALAEGGRAGLIGTNTIRQNDSRAGGLDYIVAHGGEIVDAVATRVWPGDAVVHVSVVSWVKGAAPGKKRLSRQLGDDPRGPWERFEVERVSSGLGERDLAEARPLACNESPKNFFQGQTHACRGFVLTAAEAEEICRDERSRGHVFPYLTGDDLLGAGGPGRWVIDLNEFDALAQARAAGAAFERVRALVLPEVRRKAAENPEDAQRQAHLRRWWRFWRPRPELVARLREVSRYIVCVRVTRRPIFVFVDPQIRPNDAVQAFTLADDYSFGILQSRLHWQWFTERCSTLKGDYRYTSETVWRSFPWPQTPARAAVREVCGAARALRDVRAELLERGARSSLRSIHRALEVPGTSRLRDAQEELDRAVRRAYDMRARADELTFLADLNLAITAAEAREEVVQGPGVPAGMAGDPGLVSEDRLRCRAPWTGRT